LEWIILADNMVSAGILWTRWWILGEYLVHVREYLLLKEDNKSRGCEEKFLSRDPSMWNAFRLSVREAISRSLIQIFTSILLTPIGLLATKSRPSLEPKHPPIQWAPGALTLGLRRQEREADHSPPYGAKAKNVWRYASTPQYAFMEWCWVRKSTVTLTKLFSWNTVGIRNTALFMNTATKRPEMLFCESNIHFFQYQTAFTFILRYLYVRKIATWYIQIIYFTLHAVI
jgi:hypothetical protein